MALGEGTPRYQGKEDARKHIHGEESIAWNATMVNTHNLDLYRDNANGQEFESNYFTSIRSNYLPLGNETIFIIEPYSSHRFSRQFGIFFQDDPLQLGQNCREASLEDGLNFHELCVDYIQHNGNISF